MHCGGKRRGLAYRNPIDSQGIAARAERETRRADIGPDPPQGIVRIGAPDRAGAEEPRPRTVARTGDPHRQDHDHRVMHLVHAIVLATGNNNGPNSTIGRQPFKDAAEHDEGDDGDREKAPASARHAGITETAIRRSRTGSRPGHRRRGGDDHHHAPVKDTVSIRIG